MDEANRVRWQCRRGMLELDIALSQFLEAEYARLPRNLQHAFRALLELADPDLWEAICGAEPSADEDVRIVLSMLRRIKSQAV